jgi:hypothetical protein
MSSTLYLGIEPGLQAQEIGYRIAIKYVNNVMCEFFKQPDGQIEDEEAHLAD